MIRVENIHKRYGTIQALEGVDFQVEAGETFGIIGPNGAGKSTLLKILLGLVYPDRGSITIDGLSLTEDPVGIRSRIGYVPQTDGFDDRSTGRESLRFLARLRGVSLESVEPHLRAVGVEDLLDRPVGTLSGGQRQRLSLAAALVGEPPVLLLDEPTASLDPRATADFRELMEALSREGRTLILCSHLLGDVERLCDRVLVLLDGRVETIESNRIRPPAELWLDIENTESARRIVERFGSGVAWRNGSGLSARIPAEQHLELIRALDRAGIPIGSLETRRPSLEDRFLETMRKRDRADSD